MSRTTSFFSDYARATRTQPGPKFVTEHGLSGSLDHFAKAAFKVLGGGFARYLRSYAIQNFESPWLRDPRIVNEDPRVDGYPRVAISARG
ncbi:MAG: hypothetical protein KBF88_10465 [Polyangiaceae bacterium]|nr:hypothetical protein [Polyangiaceae bacterium]